MHFIEGEPPTRSPRYDEVTALLREHPGQWAEIRRGASNYIGALASRFRGRGGRRYLFMQRSEGYGTGRSVLYGRYVPDPDDA
jgi:hypothetical protein